MHKRFQRLWQKRKTAKFIEKFYELIVTTLRQKKEGRPIHQERKSQHEKKTK
jgi:hypothetical protein